MDIDDRVLVFSRKNCHLCELAETLLKRHGLQPRTIDIDSDPQLVAKYGDCVPVVVIDGKVRFRGRVSETLLVRLLHARLRS